MDRTELEAGLAALLGAQGFDELFEAIARHPAVLSLEALQALQSLAHRQERREARDHLLMIGSIVSACLEKGVEQVRAEIANSAKNGTETRQVPAAGWEKLAQPDPRQAAAVTFAAQVGRILAFFDGHEGVFAASLQAGVGFVLQANAPPGDADWSEAVINAFERAIAQLPKEVDPYAWAIVTIGLGDACAKRLRGDRSENLERAISRYENALTVLTRDSDARGWALTSSNLGAAYAERLRGDRAENVERAIACFEDALTVRTRDSDARGFAESSSNLGAAYAKRLRGDRAENLERAIACFEDALTVRTRDSDARGWAETTHNLGSAYAERLRGDRAENLERAIACFEDALTVRTRDSDARGWAETTHNLGSAYAERLRGDRAENLERAIACFENALTVCTRDSDARGWAETTYNLGSAYSARLRGDRAENLERAIGCYEDALTVRTRDSDARGWAQTTNNLGSAYFERLRGNRAENLERAISCFEDALTVLDAGSWAGTCTNLGAAYAERLRGDRSENLERAIGCFEDALTVLTRDSDARSWAATFTNLGNAYSARLRGDRAENLERAIGCYEDAVTVRTRNSDAPGWAETSTNLGNAYSARLRGDRSENLERAIGCCEDALTVHTRDSDAWGWATTSISLGIAYAQRLRGDRSENLERAIGCYEDAQTVHTRDSDARGWATTSINLGSAYAERLRGDRSENLERAIGCYRDAAETGGLFLSPVRIIRAFCQVARLLLSLGRHRWGEAWTALRDAEATFGLYGDEALTPEAKREMLAALSDVGRWSAVIAVAQGDVGRGLEKLEASRGVALREALSIDVVLARGLDPARREAIVAARQRINNLRREAALPAGPGQARPYPQIVGDLREAEGALAAARSAAGHGPAKSLGLVDILGAIPAGATLIAPVATEFGGLIFVIPSGTRDLDMRHVVPCHDLNEETVRQRLFGWLKAYMAMMASYQTLGLALNASRTADGERSEDLAAERAAYEASKSVFAEACSAASSTLEDTLDWLWRAVMGPALARCAELKALGATLVPAADIPDGAPPELLIMPTGDFALLPMHAAWRDRDGLKRTVLDDFVVSYTPSLYAAMAAKQRKGHDRATTTRDQLLALVNPTGDLSHSERIEVPMLARLFPASAGNDAILVGEKATKATLKRDANVSSHVHLSCHGRFDWLNPDSSGLLLAARQWLTLPEIVVDLDLRACRWLMLAACETGMADIETTPDEAVGQMAAFLQAGAASVTGTFWSVPDVSTALFVGQAYEEHRSHGLSPKRATREAALWLRDLPVEALAFRGGEVNGEAIGPVRGFAEVIPDGPEANPAAPHMNAKPFRSPLFWAPFACWGA